MGRRRNLDDQTRSASSNDESGVSRDESRVRKLERGATVGRYTLLERVGEGGMGVVHAAWDPRLDRKIAIKLIHPAIGPERASHNRDRLLREARALARLAHANVVTVYDVDVTDDLVFVAMEFVDGQTLRHWVDAEPRDWRAIVGAYVEAGRGLAAAHALGIVHRDFKPDNVLVDRRNRVRVVDFGLVGYGEATETSAAAPDWEPPGQDRPRDRTFALTRTHALLGTRGYTAPEQLRGDRPHASADQFSFCVSLWEALFGLRPFDAATLARMAQAPRDASPPFLPQSAVPSAVTAALQRSLRAEPTQRFASMDELLAVLGRADHRRPRRRHLWAALLCLLILGAGFAWRVRARTVAQLNTVQSLVREANRRRAALREARLLPLHDLAREREALRRQLALIESRPTTLDHELPDVGLALGSGYLALGELDRARVHLEAAWNSGERSAELSDALSRTLVRLFEKRRAQAWRAGPAERSEQWRALESDYREPALRSLRIAERQPFGSSALQIRARIAQLEHRLDDALALAKSAALADTNDAEAAALEARIAAEKLREPPARDDPAATRALTASELQLHTQIAAIARSDDEMYAAAAEDLSDGVLAQLAQGRLARELVDRALDAGAAARRVNLDSDAALTVTRLREWVADYRIEHGQDPRADLTAATMELRAYLERHPRDGEALFELASIAARRAQYELALGRDPLGHFRDAVAALETALSVGPAQRVRDLMAEVSISLALYEQQRGIDPRPDYARAAKSAGRMDLATLRPRGELARANYALAVGADPEPALLRASRDLQRALRVDPNDADANREQLELDALRVRAASAAGRARVTLLHRAEQSASRALAASEAETTLPQLVDAAAVELERASLDGAERRTAIAAGLAACQRALAMNPRALRAREVCFRLKALAASSR